MKDSNKECRSHCKTRKFDITVSQFSLFRFLKLAQYFARGDYHDNGRQVKQSFQSQFAKPLVHVLPN